MSNLRKHGQKPYKIAVVHGGPGAAGEMKSVAEELAKDFGVLEPLQTAETLDGQVQELKGILEQHGTLPVTLAGHSWGAWLAYILAARYPGLAKKLILIGSGPFEQKYAESIMTTRWSRLGDNDRQVAQALLRELDESQPDNPDALARFGRLISRADEYKPIPADDGETEIRQNVYRRVWPEACELRSSGELLGLGGHILCPVVAIHGDYDPHPVSGVKEPLSRVVRRFRLHLIKNCGHRPWIEQEAKSEFYRILKEECASGG
jgi:pimeloyl-ACP methyl ester carboxylesterase